MNDDRWSTRSFDLIKGAVLLGLLLFFAVSFIRSSNTDAQESIQAPEAAQVQILDQVASEDGLTLSGSAEAGSTVELWVGDTRLASVPVDASGIWTTTVQTESGENQIVARSVDTDGTTLSELKVVVLDVSESTPQTLPSS